MEWKKEFIDFSFKKKVLKFGKFILKSGRTSPYFFNSGTLSSGKDINKIGLFYAHSIIHSKIKFNVLFGPAYKGIPIVVATAIALKNYYNLNIPYSFNRKEQKKYGEKGDIIGSQIKNKKIIILDDVVTSGKALNNSIQIIEKKEAKISSVFVLLDRKEKGERNFYELKNFKNKKKYKIISMITITDLISYILEKKELHQYLSMLIQYRKKYGIS
ncbi:orotate phosphoribosyltransferase [Buchnera aphidicola (Muscaphis stroyani)]|uniref:Orotate phosphoribosyltransferase n=1 Tax=Buchnera aphidicola (Muscaphis stroyani) TaxID=1241869 RepID=A0A4D6YFW3_9GAMM|nr:orotate phosphoribosyltransferase [Buchnera aphidicola]QCI24590.1 orotate phosphoribosyltransferase [Buchnera aphidicola (Muscaphis stroyani)]